MPGFSREEVASEARQDASKAILGGQLYICDAGTIAIYSPGITPENRELVSDLPHCLLPAGCTDPRAFRSIYYAQIFNSEIVRYLAANPPETQ